jgi:hypothetical protein
MVGVVEHRPWTPTKRRGPIGAEHASPGPACVQLPHLVGKQVSKEKRLNFNFKKILKIF